MFGYLQERLFEDRVKTEQRKQDAIDAMDLLQAGGVVSTPDFFWHADSGETLLERVKRLQHDRTYQGYGLKVRS